MVAVRCFLVFTLPLQSYNITSVGQTIVFCRLSLSPRSRTTDHGRRWSVPPENSCKSARKSRRDSFLGQRSDQLVPSVVPMQAVKGQLLLQHSPPVHHRRTVVEINKLIPRRVVLDPTIQRDHLLRRPALARRR